MPAVYLDRRIYKINTRLLRTFTLTDLPGYQPHVLAKTCNPAHTGSDSQSHRLTTVKSPAVAFMFYIYALHLCCSTATACVDDTSCSLNGACTLTTGKCVCRAPWTGSECHLLDFKPAKFPLGYGMAPNLTSWGGGAIFEAPTKLFHLYVSTITNDCPLQRWQTNSRIDHVVSEHPTGPYRFSDVAVPTWAHNSAPVTLTNGTFAIFHLGNASAGANGGHNCTKENTEEHTNKPISPLEGGHRLSEQSIHQPAGYPWTTIHVATSLNGPWTVATIVPSSREIISSCKNPAPWVHPNSSIYLVCGSTKSLYRAEDIRGPWVRVAGVPDAGEDPCLFTDTEGHWHLLHHSFSRKAAGQCANSTVSSHAFSTDGLHWRVHPIQPYSTQIAMASGETTTVSTRERPKLLFNKAGVPTHLFNGVCSASACRTPGGRNQSACVNCKGRFWDYTLVLELQLSPVGGTSAQVGGASAAVSGILGAVGGTSAAVGGALDAVGGTSAAVGGALDAVGGTSAAVGGALDAVGGASAVCSSELDCSLNGELPLELSNAHSLHSNAPLCAQMATPSPLMHTPS
jgi:hypothetical protein